MAKLGEGDSRWIVSERSDGKNVANWHWTEKDMMPFMKKRFPELIQGLKLENGNISVKFTKVDKLDGEANSLNRKGKPIFLYDLTVKLNWEGTTRNAQGEEVNANGSVELTDIDQDDDKYSVSVKVDSKDERAASPIKEFIRLNVEPKVKEKIHVLVQEAKASVQIFPVEVKQVTVEPDVAVKLVQGAHVPTKVASVSSLGSSTPPSQKGSRTIRQKIVFDIVTEPLFETFTDERRISAFTGGPCTIPKKEGESFSMFGNSVVGKQVTIENNKKIVQQWRFQSWPEGHFSTVTWEFNPQGEKTELILTQTDVPAFDFERTKGGWEEFFWRRVKGLFGWNYKLTQQ